eukprot:4184314-Pyramimonas_sp.AAC.1
MERGGLRACSSLPSNASPARAAADINQPSRSMNSEGDKREAKALLAHGAIQTHHGRPNGAASGLAPPSEAPRDLWTRQPPKPSGRQPPASR